MNMPYANEYWNDKKKLEEKEYYYSLFTDLVNMQAKLGEKNEECFENIFYLMYLIPLLI